MISIGFFPRSDTGTSCIFVSIEWIRLAESRVEITCSLASKTDIPCKGPAIEVIFP